MMKKIQWILYDQCHIRYIEPGVTDVVFLHYTPEHFRTPLGKTTLNLRSRIAEYAIARAFLHECKQSGYRVQWIECTSYQSAFRELCSSTMDSTFVLMRPSEEYLARRIEGWGFGNIMVPNRQFLIEPSEFREIFSKPPIMETFYRYMRKSRHILLDEHGMPLGGKWNYDHENRNFDASNTPSWNWKCDNTRFITEAQKYFNTDIEFELPVTSADAHSLFDYFLEHHSEHFGRLEDAMYQDDVFVHHSFISTALNFGLLHPTEIIEKLLATPMPLASQEAYIRQILGWREYMRQFYLFYYDDIYDQNVLEHHEIIPETWWNYDGNENSGTITGMNCVDTVLHRVQHHNYSHHIERLMVIGNYSLLMGYDPMEVNRWFYEMYTDAFEWVVTPNVVAMSQYTDGGRLATKPYISGGNYIEKMSNYCKNCPYSVKTKTCPMTHLYWSFIERNKHLFQTGRTPYILSTLRKLDIEKIETAKKAFLATLSPKSSTKDKGASEVSEI